jgi:hypothetical protein
MFFYSTRYFWRLLVLVVVIYLAATAVPWDSLARQAKTARQKVEWQAKRLWNNAGAATRNIGNSIKREFENIGK